MRKQFQLSDEEIKTVWGGSPSHSATIMASGPDDQGRDDPAPVGDDQGRDDPAPPVGDDQGRDDPAPVGDDQGKDDGGPPPDDAGRDDT